MADLSKITCPDGTTVDILSKTTRGIVRGIMDDTNSTATSFVISAPGINSLYDGATFICRNTKITSASGCVMDVNGLGAKDMWCSQGDSAVTTHWTKGYEIIWVYDATNEHWVYYQGRGTTDTSALMTTYARFNIAGNGIKQYSLFASIGCDQYSSFTTDSGTGTKTFDTTTEFDFSKIYYHSSSSDKASGARLTTNSVMYWAAQLVNLRYTLNGVTTSTSSSSLKKSKPVYLVFTPTQGTFGTITSPYFIQDIAADGVANRVYVLIGWVYDSYRADLTMVNTAYIKWINPEAPEDIRIIPWVPGTKNALLMGENSYVEGIGTTTWGRACHAEGYGTTADGFYSHAEGIGTYAYGNYSHVEGCETDANGVCSHAEGYGTIADGDNQHVSGKFNIADNNNDYVEIIGNGSSDISRSNARTLDWSGNESISGTHSCYDTSYINNLTINAKSSTNGVSQTGEYISNIFVEKNGYQIGRVGVDAVDTGRIGVHMSSTNYNSSGTEMVSNSLILNSYKDGTASVAISHPDKWRDSLGLTNNQVANDGYVLKTGNIYCTSPATDISSIANNTNTATGTLKFPAGLYILIYYCRFGYASGSGYRYISINNSNAAGSYGILNQASMAGFSGTDAHMQLVSFLKFSSETSIYLRAYQNSGSTLSLAPRYNVIKLY